MGRVRRARVFALARVFAFGVVTVLASLTSVTAIASSPASATTTGRVAAPATTVTVAITDTGFSPPTIDVPAGTVVVWTNEGAGTHTVTASDGSFASDELAPGSTFPFQFTQAGTFQYRDIHTGAVGTVTVVAGNVQGTATAPAAPAAPATPAAPAPGAAATNPAGGPTMAFTGAGDYVLAAVGAIVLAFGWTLARRHALVAAPFRVDRETAHTIERARRCRSEFLPARRRAR